nr:hypothetical protein 51 [Balneolaceae bacterium]
MPGWLRRIKQWWRYRDCEKEELRCHNLSWLEAQASDMMMKGWRVYRPIHVYYDFFNQEGTYRVILVKPEE